MKKRFILWVLLAVLLLPISLAAIFVGPQSDLKDNNLAGYNEANDKVSFHNLHVDAEVGYDNKIYITETFSVKFNDDQISEIIRALPYYSTVYRKNNNGKVEKETVVNKISEISKESENNETLNIYTDEVNGFIVVGIKSDYFVPINETRTYTLRYTYDLGADYNKGFDDIYFNIIGTNSLLTIKNITFTISLPDDVESAKNIMVYYGKEGSTNTLEYDSSGNLIAGQIDKLNPYEGITFRAVFNDEYFKRAPEFNVSALICFILGLLSVAILILYIIKFRNKNIIIPVEVVKPKDMNVFMAEFYSKGNVSIKAIIASIVDMAHKGYVKINQIEKDVEIIKNKDIPENEIYSYKQIYNTLFKEDDTVKIEDLNNKIGPLAYGIIKAQNTKIKKDLYKQKERRLSLLLKTLVTGFACLLFILSNIATIEYLGFMPSIYILQMGALLFNLVALLILMWNKNKYYLESGIISAVSLIIYFVMYLGRGFVSIDGYYLLLISSILMFLSLIFMKGEVPYKKGKDVEKGRVLGFKRFIKLCEVEQLKMFVDENPTYYFDVLPYAYVFDLSDEWIKKFETIELQIPETFTYDASPITDILIYKALFNTFSSDIKSSVIKYNISQFSSSEGFKGDGFSGGFGGGGFSGGGSGGGGFGAR